MTLRAIARRLGGRAAKTVLLDLSARRVRRRALREVEVFVLSFPKSGRTWLTVMVGKALCTQYGYPVDDLALWTYGLTKKIKAERDSSVRVTGFGHDRSRTDRQLHYRKMFVDKREFAGKDVIFLVRDPRDTIVSYYFEMSKREIAYAGTISDFIRDERVGIRKLIAFHKNWYDHREEPRSFRVLTYEDMRSDPHAALRTVLDSVVDGIGDDVLADAVQYASFDNMRELERKREFGLGTMHAGDAADPESFKVRKGRVGGYREYLSDDDVAYIGACMREMDYPFYRSSAAVTAADSPSPVARQS